MRFLRLMVAVLATASFYLAGVELGQRYINRHRQLREVRSALRALETEIVYGRTVLVEACDRLAKMRLGAGGRLLAWTGEALAAGRPAGDSWFWAVDQARETMDLDPEDLRILVLLANSLGQSDHADQAAHLAMLRDMLAEREADAARDAHRNGRMWAYLGLLGGLGLVLLVY